jgi:hypothetical protein
MPESIRRVAKGEYEVRGTQLRIVQGDAAKWVIEGHGEDLGAFGSRGLPWASCRSWAWSRPCRRGH